jgi:hypothetical protein
MGQKGMREGYNPSKAPKADGGDDDVEGHRMNAQPRESFRNSPRESAVSKAPRADGGDDDVEGHSSRTRLPR